MCLGFSLLIQGNLKLVVDGDTTLIEEGKLVSIIAELLSTKTDMVEKALLYRTVATGRDVIDKQHTEQEARVVSSNVKGIWVPEGHAS